MELDALQISIAFLAIVGLATLLFYPVIEGWVRKFLLPSPTLPKTQNKSALMTEDRSVRIGDNNIGVSVNTGDVAQSLSNSDEIAALQVASEQVRKLTPQKED